MGELAGSANEQSLSRKHFLVGSIISAAFSMMRLRSLWNEQSRAVVKYAVIVEGAEIVDGEMRVIVRVPYQLWLEVRRGGEWQTEHYEIHGKKPDDVAWEEIELNMEDLA